MSYDVIETELVDDSPFFAPTTTSAVDVLFGQYATLRARISDVAAAVSGDFGGAMHYFLEGNTQDRFAPSVDRLFQEKGAIAALNSAFWSKALSLTDVYDCMPQKRRDEWNNSIRERTTPDFSETTVRDTIGELLGMRQQFFAERVDGLFRGLSGDHVTNAPEGFGRRMIIANVLTSYGTTNHSPCGLINDLRAVIAKFMGRDEPGYDASSGLISALRGNWGEWHPVDGGALRIRLYMKGTAHLEVHPDMAYRLNQILAHLHPMAIPAQFRQKPKKQPKDFIMLGKPLPFAVLRVLEAAREQVEFYDDLGGWKKLRRSIPNTRLVHAGDKALRATVGDVMSAIGGVQEGGNVWKFDYDPTAAIREIVNTGCIPDQRAHQFYPTPETLAARAVEWAEIGDAHTVLEPSAGQGGIADLLPKERTTCVEISALHTAILKSKGHQVVEGDFVAWAATAPKFDRIVMNPPFSEGRAKLHVGAAAGLLAPGGVLVAVVPSSMKGKHALTGCAVEWSQVYENEFAGTSASVVLMRVVRLEAA